MQEGIAFQTTPGEESNLARPARTAACFVRLFNRMCPRRVSAGQQRSLALQIEIKRI